MDVKKLTTKLVGDKRRWRAYQARTRRLPEPYRIAIDALERYLLVFGPSDGEGVLTMVDDLADLFEQSAAAGTPVRAVVGDDPLEFAEAFLKNYPEGWTGQERRRLIAAIDHAAGDRA